MSYGRPTPLDMPRRQPAAVADRPVPPVVPGPDGRALIARMGARAGDVTVSSLRTNITTTLRRMEVAGLTPRPGISVFGGILTPKELVQGAPNFRSDNIWFAKAATLYEAGFDMSDSLGSPPHYTVWITDETDQGLQKLCDLFTCYMSKADIIANNPQDPFELDV